MAHNNSWANPSKAGAAEVKQMAAFLERHAQTSDTLAVNQNFCEVIDPKPGERLLEVGCGSGLLCRMVSPQLQPDGCMVGVDISREFLAEARNYTTEAGVSEQIIFESGQAEALPYPAACFDGAFAARLLLHTANPDAAVQEMARVVKPGGRVVVMDWDFGTVSIDHPNRELTRRLIDWRTDHRGGNNWSGRQLWGRMVNAGLQNLSVYPKVTVALTKSDGFTQSLWRGFEGARDSGVITSTEYQSWLADLETRLENGTFFASIVNFIVEGWVPATA